MTCEPCVAPTSCRWLLDQDAFGQVAQSSCRRVGADQVVGQVPSPSRPKRTPRVARDQFPGRSVLGGNATPR